MKGLGGSCLRLSGPPSLIVVAQSIAGTKRRLRGGEYEGPYQLVPPCVPGRNRAPSVVSGAVTFSIRATADWHNTSRQPTARPYTYPVFLASATPFLTSA